MIKQYIKINIASPKKIIEWTEKTLPNGEKIGKITTIMRLKQNNIFINKI